MTDTVNVPIDAIDEFRRWYELDRGRAILKGKARKIVARILSAAAPKAEPVSDPYKLDWRPIDDRAPIGECVMVYWPRMALDDDGEPTDEVLDGDGHISLTMRHSVRAGWEPDNIIEANGDWFGDDFEFGEPTHWAPRPLRPQPLSNPQQLEPSDLAPMVDGKPSDLRAQPEAQKGEPFGYAYKTIGGDWVLATCREYGATHGKPLYTHPAPASDELLEALKPFADAAEDLDEAETGHIWERPAAMSIDASDLRRAYELYAKHKGPQS